MQKSRPDQHPRPVQYGQAQALKFPQFLLFLVGMPVKLRQSVIHRTPVLTWSLAISVVLVSLAVWEAPTDLHLAEWLVFRPEHTGLQWWSGLVGHMWVHGGWLHLLGNVYFLVLFGRNIECCFGRRRLFGLFLVSGVTGGLVHGVVTGIGLIGASGAVFGILAFYVCQYPRARVIWLPFSWLVRGALLIWARDFLNRGFPVAIYFAIYAAFQLLVLYEQLFHDGRVSALAHLGGGLAGLAIWWAWRRNWLP